jgi:hypothetical protein
MLAMRPNADDAVAGALGQLAVIAEASLSRLPRQRTPMQVDEGRGALRVDLIMRLADQPVADDAKGVEPAVVRCDIAQLVVEHRHRRRDIGDEARDPLRNGEIRMVLVIPCCHDDCWWFQTSSTTILPCELRESEQAPSKRTYKSQDQQNSCFKICKNVWITLGNVYKSTEQGKLCLIKIFN